MNRAAEWVGRIVAGLLALGFALKLAIVLAVLVGALLAAASSAAQGASAPPPSGGLAAPPVARGGVPAPTETRAGRTPSPDVVPGRALRFPEDEGAHPEFRTEWWYITGWLQTEDGAPLGFQVTFFRVRPDVDERNPSAFAPRQLVIGHAAVADPARGRLYTAERIARAGLGLAGATAGRTEAWIRDWRLESRGDAYLTRVEGEDFGYELTMRRTQPPMPNGEAGYSRKGPDPRSASYYYSVPQLEVTGTVRRGDRTVRVTGTAWLDQEWSTAYLDPEATGWDWMGINLADGGALMAFRIRRKDGGEHWAAATLRAPDGSQRTFEPAAVEWVPGRTWRSPRTNIVWPVEWSVTVGERRFTLSPLMDDQEKDARVSSGVIYWEGAVTLNEGGRPAGRGYLELTGYGERLRLP